MSKSIIIAEWTKFLGSDEFGTEHTRTERVFIISETAQGDITVIPLRSNGDWSGVTYTAYPNEIINRRPGVASPSGLVFELDY